MFATLDMGALKNFFSRLKSQKLEIVLSKHDKSKTENVIETIRRMETNTSLYAAGAFAPLLVLLNQLEFLRNQNSDLVRWVALAAMLFLAFSGIALVLYRAFYINLKRTQVELFLAGMPPVDNLTLTALNTPRWNIVNVFAFIFMPFGWLLIGLMSLILLLGN
ncbi:hypothetical protein [Fretibacter rubidus]|uniref:hypothetical protein n=1 Tax=Fretibacter rubidus TaxID=570162 RepID=UPI00352B4191